MKITERGQFAVLALVELARHSSANDPMSIPVLAERHKVSISYLEGIFARLREASIVRSIRGPGGGYVLDREPGRLTVADVIMAVDGAEAFTIELGCGDVLRAGDRARCLTQEFWEGLSAHMHGMLAGITVGDICARRAVDPLWYAGTRPAAE